MAGRLVRRVDQVLALVERFGPSVASLSYLAEALVLGELVVLHWRLIPDSFELQYQLAVINLLLVR